MNTTARDALAILAALAAGHDSPDAIAAVTGVSVPEVRRRLRRNGNSQICLAYRWFTRVGLDRWALTAVGERQHRGGTWTSSN